MKRGMSTRWMGVCTLFLAACTMTLPHETGSDGAQATKPTDRRARLVIRRLPGPSFTEGSISFAKLTMDSTVVFKQLFGDPPASPSVRRRVPLGVYRLTVWQRGCAGTCSEATDRPSAGRGLDPAYSRCSITVRMPSGAWVTATVRNPAPPTKKQRPLTCRIRLRSS